MGEKLLKGATEFLFEPQVEDVLGSPAPHYLNFQMYQILLEAKASEHSSRMVAMKNATDNAKELIKDLTLEYKQTSPGQHYQRTFGNYQCRYGNGLTI